MHPILSNFRRFLWHIVLWLVMGLGFIKLIVATGIANWSTASVFTLPVSLIFGFLTTSAYYIAKSFHIKKYAFFTISLVFILSAVISALLCLGFAYGWVFLFSSLFNQPILVISYQFGLSIVTTSALLYLLALLTYDMVIAFDQVKAAEQRESTARLLARDAEMQVLRSQIDPHFLFNSLHSISALTTIDPVAARDMTIALADFFRKTLTLSEKEKVTLEQELSLCHDFLAVEKIRFGNKLTTEIRIDEPLKSALIPPMILQPLLENAIKHGIRTVRVGGCITIDVIRHEEWLHIQMSNPFSAESPASAGSGMGLHNLRARFQAMYDDQARVMWKTTTDTFSIELTVPLEFAHHE